MALRSTLSPTLGYTLFPTLGYGGSVSLGLLDLYPATAAYSAYDLGNKRGAVTEAEGTVLNPVQRWRRSSDDALQMFTAAQIASGTALASIVPTDVQALYNSARYFNGTSTTVSVFDSETVPAAFQGLSDAIEVEATIVAGAVSASTLGRWSSEYTIAELREEGTTGIHVPFSFGVDNSKLTLGVSDDYTTGAEKVVGTTTLVIGQEYVVKVVISGDNYEFSLDGVSDGSGTFLTATGDRSVGANISNLTIGVRSKDSGVYDSELFQGVIRSLTINNGTSDVLAYTGLGTSVTAWQDTIGSNDGTEANGATFTGQGYDAYLLTEYDQSGNSYDLTQATAANQPLVVSGGVWVDSTFDGVDDTLPITGAGLDMLKDVGYGQVFAVATSNQSGLGTAGIVKFGNNSGPTRFSLGDSNVTAGSYRVGGRRLDADAFDSTTASTAHGGVQKIVTGLLNYADAEAYIYQNGVNVGTDLSFQTAGNTSNTSSSDGLIGTAGFSGKIAALLIYNTDQTANRAAIEAKLSTIVTTAPSPAPAPSGGTESVTMSGAVPGTSQTFSSGDDVFDNLGITKFEENFGIAVKVFFDSEPLRDAFMATVDTWSMGGTALGGYAWTPDDVGGFGFAVADPTAASAFATGTRDFVWTI